MEIYMCSIVKKNLVKKLNKLYEVQLEEAMHAQRKGDIKSYSMITTEAEKSEVQIQELERAKTHNKPVE